LLPILGTKSAKSAYSPSLVPQRLSKTAWNVAILISKVQWQLLVYIVCKFGKILSGNSGV